MFKIVKSNTKLLEPQPSAQSSSGNGIGGCGQKPIPSDVKAVQNNAEANEEPSLFMKLFTTTTNTIWK